MSKKCIRKQHIGTYSCKQIAGFSPEEVSASERERERGNERGRAGHGMCILPERKTGPSDLRQRQGTQHGGQVIKRERGTQAAAMRWQLPATCPTTLHYQIPVRKEQLVEDWENRLKITQEL